MLLWQIYNKYRSIYAFNKIKSDVLVVGDINLDLIFSRVESFPELGVEKLAALVLHSGSGIPGPQLQAAVKAGICKINLGTEVKNGFRETLRSDVSKSDKIDLRKLFPPAMHHVQNLLEDKIDVVY